MLQYRRPVIPRASRVRAQGHEQKVVELAYTDPTMNTGAKAEEIATLHLRRHGMSIVARNWRCRGGEVDIVAQDGPTLVFVEVKGRSGVRYGRPEEAVTRGKLRRMWKAAHVYLGTVEPSVPVRFDIVAVGPDGIQHLKNVLTEQGVRQDP